MKERPIIFSGAMVRAMLAGTKTQTRRVFKPQPPCDSSFLEVGPYHPTVVDRWGDEQPGTEAFGAWTRDGEWSVRCPYGRPGDRLWVRETWSRVGDAEDDIHACPDMRVPAYYRADTTFTEPHRWRSPIHMPRWASRILLEITEVRVQRLQDVSEDDASAEGVRELPGQIGATGAWWTADALGDSSLHGRDPVAAFRKLWTSINGDASWNVNPSVWAITFERVEATP